MFGGGRGLSRGCFMRQAQIRQARDDPEQDPGAIARGTNRERSHQRGIEGRDIRLDHPVSDAGREEVQCSTSVGLTGVAAHAGARRQGESFTQVRTHHHRLKDAHGRSRRCKPIITPWCHACQRERSAKQPTR
jgi:hypothetical protein